MKKILTSIFFCLLVPIASAQDGIDGLTSHGPIVSIYAQSITLCGAEKFSMSIDLDQVSTEKYTNCVKYKKKQLEDAFIKANQYLKDKGFTQSQASLKKYYLAIINILSMPTINYKESIYDARQRESIERNLKITADSEWSLLATDIKLSQ
jgi:transposase